MTIDEIRHALGLLSNVAKLLISLVVSIPTHANSRISLTLHTSSAWQLGPLTQAFALPRLYFISKSNSESLSAQRTGRAGEVAVISHFNDW